jgi:hypothetical protein
MDNTARAYEENKPAILGNEAPGRHGAKTQKYLDRKLISALYETADGHYLGVSPDSLSKGRWAGYPFADLHL